MVNVKVNDSGMKEIYCCGSWVAKVTVTLFATDRNAGRPTAVGTTLLPASFFSGKRSLSLKAYHHSQM